MPQTDMPLDDLRAYVPNLAVPADFDEFWRATLDDARRHDLDVSCTPVDSGLAVIDSFDVSFSGFGGTPVRAWLHLPIQRSEPLPAVVDYVGYGSGRGLAHERVLWAAAGYAHLVMDTRGQGSSSAIGDSAHPDASGTASHAGFMTQGILDPADYYYRRVFTDAVRAVDAARSLKSVDPSRVAVSGRSQGGGISLAVAALAVDVTAVISDVPFFCDLPRAITIADTEPYIEVVNYLKVRRDEVDRALRTLSYFDAAVLARRGTAPALFSVALMDRVCPPSTVYAAFNHYAGTKAIHEYPFNDHEGGQGFHEVVKMRWLADQFRAQDAQQ